MPNQGDTAAQCVRDVFRCLTAVLPALLVSVLASIVFSFPNQLLDIYRDIAQSIVLGPIDPEKAGWMGYLATWRELISACVAVTMLSIALWLASQVLVRGLDTHGPPICWAAVGIRQFLPIAIAIAPMAMLTVGLLSARVSASTESEIAQLVKDTFYASFIEKGIDKDLAELLSGNFASRLLGSNANLAHYAVAVGTIATCLLLLFGYLQARTTPPGIIKLRLQLPWPTTTVYAVIVAAGFVALSLYIASNPVRVAWLLTPIPTFCLFCISLLLAMDAIRRLSELTGFPLLGIVVVLALVFSLADLNNNHAVRYEEAASASPAKSLPLVTDEFRNWLSKRDDRAAFGSGRSYPIYIVAAQGGGIYAAYHAANFLSEAQQECPNFAHHIFAISGVSGGSVGASVFNSMMREAETQKMVQLPNSGCGTSATYTGPAFAEAAHAVFEHDLWSPLQAALLFPDFLQRFLFRPVAKFDRALALEHALENAWLDMLNKEKFFNPQLQQIKRNYVGDAFAQHWSTEAYKNVPALVLNTTEVSTGNRRLISPFQFKGTGTVDFFPLEAVSATAKPVHLPLSTAAVLSARFPWATPLGWIGGTPRMGLVDGAYFENSGVATALDLIKALSDIARSSSGDQTLEVTLIILTSADFSPETWFGLDETLGPIQTMLNARSARGLIEIDRAKQELKAMNSERTRFRTIEVKLRGLGYPLPLGWRLSTATRYLIESQRGVKAKCSTQAEERGARGEVDCAKALIYQQLSH
jgi:hypothetical protein